MSIRDLCRAALKNPEGARTADIPGRTNAVSSAMCTLVNQGEAFAAKLSHKSVRYFDTPERAETYTRHHRVAVPVKHRTWDKNLPMVITDKTIFTQCPGVQTIRPWTSTHSPY